jgi:hypothetical protein
MPYPLSPHFPHRQTVRAIAQLGLQIEARRNAGLPVDANALRVHQAALAQFERLTPQEKWMVEQTYFGDRQEIAQQTNRQIEQQRAGAFQQQVDSLVRDLTPGIAGKPNGVNMQLASALRNYPAGVTVATRKLPTGAEADARVQRATGMTQKQYEKKLDAAYEMRGKLRYSDPAAWRAYVAEHFEGQSFEAVDRMVKGSFLESVGLELRRRAERDAPDTVKLRATPEDQRRLDLIEAIGEVEGSNSDSVFQRGQADRLAEIVSEGFDRQGNRREGDTGLRADIARAMLDHGGTFEVNVGGRGEGHEGDFATDEIVEVSDEE